MCVRRRACSRSAGASERRQARPFFVGQTLRYYPSPESRRKARIEGVPVENPCSKGDREMHFVVPEWNEAVIRRLANHYDALFAVPEALNLFFSSTYGMAAVSGQSVSFVSGKGGASSRSGAGASMLRG
jgi:hypothetical protein